MAGAAIAVNQGEVASRNAKRAGRKQAAALRAEAAAERERGRRLASSQSAAFGAAGVGAGGSAHLVQAQGIVDSLRQRNRVLVGAQNAQSNANAQAEAFRIQGLAGGIQSASNALSFAGSATSPATTTPATG